MVCGSEAVVASELMNIHSHAGGELHLLEVHYFFDSVGLFSSPAASVSAIDSRPDQQCN